MPDPACKLFILAGESSGDRIGAALIEQLRENADIAFEGVGGEAMKGQGLSSLFPLDDLAVMGYRDVILRLPLLLWRAHQVVRHVLKSGPDAVVLIDAQVFSQTVAGMLRKRGYRGPIVLYVAPAVWAWKPERAKKIAPLYDCVLAVLPFEPQAMKSLGGPETRYVGHPALARIAMRKRQPSTGPLLLLPGSRPGEIARHLPLMREVGTALAQRPEIEGLAILSTAARQNEIERAVNDWGVAVTVVSNEAARTEMLERAIAGFAVSGTMTLELALAGVPHAVTYIAEPAQVRMFEKAATHHIALPNILAGAEVVPEILFAGRAEPQRAIAAMENLVGDAHARATQTDGFAAIRTMMEKGEPEAPLRNAADEILALIGAISVDR